MFWKSSCKERVTHPAVCHVISHPDVFWSSCSPSCACLRMRVCVSQRERFLDYWHSWKLKVRCCCFCLNLKSPFFPPALKLSIQDQEVVTCFRFEFLQFSSFSPLHVLIFVFYLTCLRNQISVYCLQNSVKYGALFFSPFVE